MQATAHNGFTATGMNVCLTEGNTWPRALYRVDEETARWDGTERRFALYSDRHDVFSYCTVRVTGRKVLWNGNHRVTVRVDFDGESGQNHAGIMLRPDGSYFDLADALELVK